MPLSLAERAAAFQAAFPDYEAAWPRVVREDGRDVLYAVWLTGAQYASKSGLYGSFPPRFLPYLLALFPDVRLAQVLHAFSGSLKPGPWTRLDIRPEIAAGDAVVRPDVVGSVYDAAQLLGDRRFSLVVADPPYSEHDAKQYRTKGVHQLRATTALAQVLDGGGFLAWLSTSWPMHSKRELVTVGRFYLTASTMRTTRCCTLFQRVERVPALCSYERHCGSKASVIATERRGASITRETACDECGSRGVISGPREAMA